VSCFEVALECGQRIDEEMAQVADIVESWTEGLLSEYQRWLFPRLARLITAENSGKNGEKSGSRSFARVADRLFVPSRAF